MDFVNKKHVAILKISQNRGEIAGTFNGWTRGNTKIGAQLMCNYICHGGFTKTWRTIKKDVIQRGTIGALFDSINGDFKIALEAFLANIFLETGWAKTDLDNLLFGVVLM